MESDETKIKMSITRRSFLTTMGVGAAVAVTGRYASGASSGETVLKPEEMAKIRLHINGRSHRLLVEPRWTLLFVLREKLGFTGTKNRVWPRGMRRLYGSHGQHPPLCLRDAGGGG